MQSSAVRSNLRPVTQFESLQFCTRLANFGGLGPPAPIRTYLLYIMQVKFKEKTPARHCSKRASFSGWQGKWWPANNGYLSVCRQRRDATQQSWSWQFNRLATRLSVSVLNDDKSVRTRDRHTPTRDPQLRQLGVVTGRCSLLMYYRRTQKPFN